MRPLLRSTPPPTRARTRSPTSWSRTSPASRAARRTGREAQRLRHVLCEGGLGGRSGDLAGVFVGLLHLLHEPLHGLVENTEQWLGADPDPKGQHDEGHEIRELANVEVFQLKVLL